MSDITDRIHSVEPGPNKRATRAKKVAPAIRKLKSKYPEMTQREIAAKVGCTPGNVHHVLSRYSSRTSEAELRGYQENKADVVDLLAHRVAMSITDAKLKKMTAAQAFIALGIAIDKSQLLHGQPTSLNVTVLMDVVEAMRQRPQPSQQRAISDQSAEQ